ncbi:hypothetical protein J7E78_19905 [Paenibacillus polymyxa]|uniref:hypothetical protein n=1 Tax=Paenibacillus polymyxa TaxID=1406 RepID=UPI001BE533BE|nr:hypothetical protein [Paenibacillus polymyxa]MBT2285811.1 hypothetical protein [Paenibacillus polymyxa]
MKIKVGIIDDDKSKTTQIMTKLIQGLDDASPEKKEKYSHYEFEPIEVELLDDVSSMVGSIKELGIDCAIIDYKLSSYQTVNFSGVELAKAIEREFYEFPIFILTSYDDDLFSKEVYNAYQIFDFDRYLSEKKERIELNFKLIEQVLKTQKQKENWNLQLKKLLPLAGTSEEIDSAILDLDSKIEKSTDGRHALPEKLKKDLSSNKLSELIDKIDEILEEE